MNRPDEDFVDEIDDMLSATDNYQILLNSNQNHIRDYLGHYSSWMDRTGPAKTAARMWEVFASDAVIENYGTDMDEVEMWWERAFICRRYTEYDRQTNDLEDLFFFAVTGLLSDKLPQVSVILDSAELPEILGNEWDERLRQGIMKAMILLIRKSRGWDDILEAQELVDQLHEDQEQFEDQYLEEGQNERIVRVVALYNMVKIVDLSAEYITRGSPSGVLDQITRFGENAKTALDMHKNPDISLMLDMVILGCRNLIENSLWFQTRGLATGSEMREYIESLADAETGQPILDLMPSQQAALQEDPLSMYQRAIVINMPTSAGKTLLAEFSIVQSKSVNEESTVIYLVPTRALVNQTTLTLRRRLSQIGLSVESAVPAFELDPTEDEFLEGEIDVLVSTPEKLDLLLKEGHSAVSDISLVVADEAHNIQDGSRGANLELLLSTINREFENVRFLLLSPFVPNGDQIAEWLGGNQSKRISVDWRASDQVTGISRVLKERNGPEYVELTIVPSSTKYVEDEFTLELHGPAVEGNRSTKKKSAATTALNLVSDDGTVLILCMSKSKALERARDVLPYLDEVDVNEDIQLVLDFIKADLGEDHFLIEMLHKGVAVHHGGIPLDIRYLIERLAEQGKIKILTATTTLAQGVNFPIKHIVLEGTYLQGGPPDFGQHLSHNQFWNIAGRAGRAFRDHMGGIIFAAGSKSDFEDYKTYLESDADNVLSAIQNALTDLEDLQQDFDLQFVRTNKEFASFIRYILHTVNVSSYQKVQSDLEDVLRSSLIYYQLEDEEPELADWLISLTRAYLDEIGVIAENPGIVDMIDRTGFTSISVNALLARQESERLQQEQTWASDQLFAADTQDMNTVLNVIKDIPEVDLGRFTGDELNVNDIAGIVKRWVHGDSLEEISDEYFDQMDDREARIIKASDYVNNNLMGYISWGMSALQKVSAFGNDDLDLEEVGHVPALVYYGVNSEEAAALRMVGVPRNIAEGLGDQYKEDFEEQPSFDELREWLNDIDQDVWSEASGFENISGERARRLWRILNGLE